MPTHSSYQRIATAIEYIAQNFQRQPNLDEIAEQVHLSPAHFHRMFSEWAGTSPKKFLQYISLQHAKLILKQGQDSSLFNATFDTGLSSTSRLHDLFVNIEGMTPVEYRNGGQNLQLAYHFADTPFGQVIIASTDKGICYLAFDQDRQHALNLLQAKFPQANFVEYYAEIHKHALAIFAYDQMDLSQIKLHLKGTAFQLKVWEALLKISMGQLSTYGAIAQQIGDGKAYRAVGTALGQNPVAFLIPCHRVIQATGHIGGYMWGSTRKTVMVGWEAVHTYEHDD